MPEIKILSQTDPRWKDKQLGFSSTTIGNYGCLMTCMTMLANYYGNNETPETVNDKMKAIGGYQDNLIYPYLFPKAIPGMIYKDFMDCQNVPAPMSEIDAWLGQGKPVIVMVDYAPSAGLQNHWIVLAAKKGSDYVLFDPWPYPAQSGEVTLTTSRYKFAGAPQQMIKGVVFLTGSAPVAPPPAPKLDKGVRTTFPVYATADGLALRSDTVVADYTLVKRVPLGAKLTILLDDATAKSKIGVMNQWIPVLDPADNTQAMTAAWYVSLTPPGAAPAASPSTPAPAQPVKKPANLIVKTIDEGVALRTKPEISDAALAKRVPVNTELICQGSYDDAAAKVGVVYQWLQVKDVTGAQYWVAAWYVKAVNGLASLGVKDQGSVSFAVPDEGPQKLIVRSAVEGLAFRSLPLITQETLIKRLPMDGELYVQEDAYTAEGKLGKVGEWLHVCDIEGNEGYVAAWYCVRRPDLAIADDKPLLG